jgi:hypothetical protein
VDKVVEDAQAVLATITELICETGQPVVFVREGDTVKIGVLNFSPDPDDWFWLPVPVEQLINQQ